MSMKKTANVKLETTANYQASSNLNVRFWNQDTNTAELKFLITRNNFPLSLSKENVKVVIALESGKNFIASDEFVIDTETDGVARFDIPSDFLRVAKDVTGQVYVATVDGEETIVERQFTFQVSNDLLSNIPSEEKIRYIKMFDDLKREIQDRLTKLENDFMVMEDYVVEVQQATTNGLNALNNLVDDRTVEYNTNHTTKVQQITDTGDAYTADFTDQRDYIDTEYAKFKESVLQSGVVTDANAEGWQKYKMTNDDGSRMYLTKGSFPDVHALEPGYYETVSADTPTQGFPEQFANAAFIEIDVTKSENGRKQIKVTQSSRPQTFVKYLHTDGIDNGWKEVLIVDDAKSIETVVGSQSKANTAENNSKIYTDSKINSQYGLLFNGSVSKVNSVVNLTGDINDYRMILVSGSYPNGEFHEMFVPAISGNVINFQSVNLRDSDGMLLGMYEIRIEINSGTKWTITNDVAYDNISDTGSGPGRNAYTITRIEGFN